MKKDLTAVRPVRYSVLGLLVVASTIEFADKARRLKSLAASSNPTSGRFFRRISMKRIPLTRGMIAVVDDEDYENLIRHSWHYTKSPNAAGRAARRLGPHKLILMHQEVMGEKPGHVIDHINHNPLDNRRCNLRFCTQSQNQWNRTAQGRGTSKYKGVHWKVDRQKWRARIYTHGKELDLGGYDNEKDAALAYDKAARELHGEFACCNFEEASSCAQ